MRKQLLDDIKEMRECYKLKEAALDRTVRRTGIGRGCVLVVRHWGLCNNLRVALCIFLQ
jgi:hypothetical protein